MVQLKKLASCGMFILILFYFIFADDANKVTVWFKLAVKREGRMEAKQW